MIECVMPDFLHEEKEKGPSASSMGAFPFPSIRRHTFRSRRPGSGPSEKRVNVKGKNGTAKKGTAKKGQEKKGKEKSSALFTDYYGMAFLGLIGAFAAAGYFVINPLFTEFREMNGEIEYRLQTLEEERDYFDSLERSIAAAESIPENTLLRVDEALPRDVQIPKLLVTIAKICALNDIALSNIQFSPVEESEEGQAIARRSSVEVIPFGISLTLQSSGYQATRSFLEDLEDSVRILDVSNITVTGNDQDGSLSYSLDLTTYAIQKKESLRGLEDPLGGMMMDDATAGQIP